MPNDSFKEALRKFKTTKAEEIETFVILYSQPGTDKPIMIMDSKVRDVPPQHIMMNLLVIGLATLIKSEVHPRDVDRMIEELPKIVRTHMNTISYLRFEGQDILSA
jgi:hypothetical protein